MEKHEGFPSWQRPFEYAKHGVPGGPVKEQKNRPLSTSAEMHQPITTWMHSLFTVSYGFAEAKPYEES